MGTGSHSPGLRPALDLGLRWSLASPPRPGHSLRLRKTVVSSLPRQMSRVAGVQAAAHGPHADPGHQEEAAPPGRRGPRRPPGHEPTAQTPTTALRTASSAESTRRRRDGRQLLQPAQVVDRGAPGQRGGDLEACRSRPGPGRAAARCRAARSASSRRSGRSDRRLPRRARRRGGGRSGARDRPARRSRSPRRSNPSSPQATVCGRHRRPARDPAPVCRPESSIVTGGLRCSSRGSVQAQI